MRLEGPRRATFEADLPDGRRIFTAPESILERDISSAKIVRKRGKDTVVLKFRKAEPRSWGLCFEGYADAYPNCKTVPQEPG